MRVHFCGVRGSTPAPGAEFIRYGGHTSCLALSTGAGDAPPSLLLDAGTGARRVTELLGGRPFVGTILLTHLHWDHVQGLPFFSGADREDSSVSLLLPSQEGGGVTSRPEGDGVEGDADGGGAEEVLARSMSPPHFPIRPSQLRGAWSFGTVKPGPLDVGCFSVEARSVPHKGGATLGYRVTDGASTIAYIPDHCPTAIGPGPDGWGEYHPAVLELARDVDVLVHDAHLLPAEMAAEAAFGHAAADYAVSLAERSGARRVVLFHHKPDRTDDALDELSARWQNANVDVSVAAELTVLDL